jgi:predicted Zn-dependent peptidase
MVWDSAPKDDDIEHERSVIESEILASLDDPEECGTDQAIALMFPGNSLSRSIAGSVDDIRGISAQSIRSFISEDLRCHSPIIAIAGSFVPDEAESFLVLRTRGMAICPLDRKSPAPVWNPGFFCPVSHFNQSQIFLSYPVTFSRDTKDWFSWDLINAITGSTVSSRLFQSLRERHGLCYSIFSSVNFGRDFALWGAYLATPRESTVRALDLLVKEIDDIVQYGFTETEIRDARTHIIGELLLSAEDTENRMKRLARQYLFGDTVYTIDECIEIVNDIGDVSLFSHAVATFRKDTASLVIYSDKKMAKECRKNVSDYSLRC